MPELDANGIRIHYETDGSGPPVVLVHGLGGTGMDVWKKQAAPLAGEFHVVTYDQRGCGRTTVTPGPYTVELLATDLDALLDGLGLDRVALVGHSAGGGLVLHYAATRPARVAAVAGVGAVVELAEPGREAMEARAQAVEGGDMAGVAVTVATNGMAPSFREAHPEEFQEWISLLGSNDPSGYAAHCRAIVAMAGNADLARVEAPAVLVAGELDQASPLAVNRDNATRLPNAELVEIADCAHIIPWEKPDELLAALQPFLRRAAG